MRHFFCLYIFTTVLFIQNEGIFAQNLKLKLTAIEKSNQSILDSLIENKSYKNEKAILMDLNTILGKLKRAGYLTAVVSEYELRNSVAITTIKLGEKTDFIIVRLTKEQMALLEHEKRNIKLKLEQLDPYRKSIGTKLLSKGIPFTEVIFSNYKFKGSTLTVELIIKKSKTRSIDKVIIRGYDQFPESFVKHFFLVDNKTIFTPDLIEQIETQITKLSFAKATRKPEVLFKKDSTILYLSIEKLKKNSIDALVNVSTDETNSLQLNGLVDLSLNNIFNSGEQLSLYWNRVGENQSEIDIKTKLPYLFNTKISSDFNFNIYRQDSTFLNTSINLNISYPLNQKTNLGMRFQSISSNQIDNSIPTASIKDYNKILVGGFIQISSNSTVFNGAKKLEQRYNVSFGNRKTDQIMNQIQIESEIQTNFQLSNRSILNIQNLTGLQYASNYLQNDIFRIGGINSIRSLNEQSIFASKFNITNVEFQYYTSKTNYLHSITDIAWIQNLFSDNEYFYALGLGYSFARKNSIIQLGYVYGGKLEKSTRVNSSRLIVKFNSIF